MHIQTNLYNKAKWSFMTIWIMSVALATFAASATAEQTILFSEIKQYTQHKLLSKTVATNHSVLSSQISAQLKKIVALGTQIKKGQVLASLDCRAQRRNLKTQQNLLEQQNNALKWAQKALKRARKTVAHTAESILDSRLQEVEQIALQRDGIKINIQNAKQSVNDCSISAPFDGTVTEKIAQLGSFLNVGSPVVRLLETSKIQIEAAIPVDLIQSFKTASSYWIEMNGQKISISINHSLPIVQNDQYSQLFRLSVAVKDFNTGPIVGLSLPLHWKTSESSIPTQYLQQHNNTYGVWIDKQGSKAFVPLAEKQIGQRVQLDLPDDTRIYTP